MIKTLHRADAQSRTDDIFVVRYTGRHTGYYLARIVPFILVFAAFACLYLDDESRWIFSRGSVSKPFSWIEFIGLLAFVAGAVADLVLTLRRVQPGELALSISRDGITGAVRHVTRLMPWSEIADVKTGGKFVVVRRQPRSWIQKLFASRGLGNINIPVRQLDHDAGEILAAVHRLAHPVLDGTR